MDKYAIYKKKGSHVVPKDDEPDERAEGLDDGQVLRVGLRLRGHEHHVVLYTRPI